ncbi:MAG: Lrp/AsnC ligand binding domain-containing protein [Candidatus Bathyarchaeota archaeon]|nr:Lrp/AsnC ligand binding domain-containing protein [Candidatus Bathyarchaeota archaeon]
MENVFEESHAVITTSSVADAILEKPKRSAFVFITAESEASQVALHDLELIDEVEEVYLARGAYDIVAKVSGESFDHVREIIWKRIRSLSSIKATLTLTMI